MRLARRAPLSPADFEQAMAVTQSRYCKAGYRPESPPIEDMDPGTYYLSEVDSRYRRRYTRNVT